MVILGVHAGHDCGAAIIINGKIAAAINEERITRNKLAFGVPKESVREVMSIAGIVPDEVDEIALETISIPDGFKSHGRPWAIKALCTKGRALKDFFYVRGKKLETVYGLKAIPLNLLAMTGFPRFIMTDYMAERHLRTVFGPQKNIVKISHHESHVASAYYTSNMNEALSVVVEEYDGRNGMTIDYIRNGQIHPVAASPYPHSPGVFYSLVTRMLGFNQMLHAGKITGLAAYAPPENAYHLVKKLMWDEGMEVRLSPLVYDLVAEYARTKIIPDYFEGKSPEELSAAFQRRLEDVLVTVVTRAVKATGARNILLSGGVVANVKLNQRIFNIPGVETIFVHPGMSDCGTAVGAALSAASKTEKTSPYRLENVFMGYEITDDEAERELSAHGLKYIKEPAITKRIAEILAQGKIVVRVRGKMEYGPRALGNRTILYHCNDPSINNWLNKRLRRTEFMPFAPAVPLDYINRCFLDYQGAEYTAEFMTITFDCTPWMKETCPAVVHIDGTARPQIVTPTSNQDFYNILSEYNRITGIPVLINTSYNIHNEPIVMTADDAIRVFKETCLDYLAINNCLVSASENGLIWNEQ
jgi:carbamoyltransferase